MVEEMATETWLWVKSILPFAVLIVDILSMIRNQGKIMYLDTAEMP
jgi:hypothetical protein